MPKCGKNRNQVREKIIRKLREKLLEVKRTLDLSGNRVLLIGLIGSFARGDWWEGSDIDIVIVCEGVSGPSWKRLDLEPIVIERHPTEYHIYSPEEFELLARDARMIVYDLFTEGVILYADEEYLHRIRRIFEETIKSLKVTKIGSCLIRRLDQ